MKFPLLFYIFFLVQCSVAIVGVFYYKKLPRALRILEWLIVINVTDSALQWLLASFNIHSLWTMHFYTLIEFFFVVMIYSSWMKQRRNRLVFLLCLAGFTILWIVSKFSFEPLSLTDDWTATISKVLQIIFSIYLLLDIVKESDIVWTNDPRFWIATSTIIYAAGSLFWYALFNEMLKISPDLLKQSFSLIWILMIIANLLYARGFLCKK
jgi:hypothetical protein